VDIEKIILGHVYNDFNQRLGEAAADERKSGTVFSRAGVRGRRCFITGGAGGVGAATARRFCQEGAHVVISDLDAQGVERIAAELTAEGFTAHAVALDVTDDAAVSAAVAAAARRLGGLDTLIANAGILTVDRIEDLTPEAFRRTLEVNVIGTFQCIRHSVALLREAGGGAIVCTASQAGLEGVPEATAYCASKFGVVGIVQSLARELARDGIRVTGVAPGLVDTPMLTHYYERRARIHGRSADQLRREAVAKYPIGRLATPTEVADVIVFLASDLASYITGATVPVIGGQLSR
jgi:NAD(P)-dependent dehydrogenase (short-subunit alcohol dehydrogenase family)